MQFTKNAKGFTLIELLVVITIIGILAVGGTTVYTSQIQKARDTTRITDVEALKNGVEQVYQDKGSYPEIASASSATAPGFKTVNDYNPKFGKDPKSGQSCGTSTGGTNSAAGSPCDYYYGVAADTNSIANQIYKISTGFENKGNIDSKGVGDGGTNDARYELGILSGNNNTLLDNAQGAGKGTMMTANIKSTAATCTAEFGLLVIKGGVCP
ncbi:MAG: type II secretion system protein [Patescibacteria group bacterium]